MKNAGIFCKTFRPDLGWLYFAVSSVIQNWRHPWEHTDFVVLADSDCEPEISRWGFDRIRVIYTHPWPDGYCHAMALKLCADIVCPTSEIIFMLDSDMMLVRPTELSDLMEEGRPLLTHDSWDSTLDPETRQMAKQVWGPAVRRSMGCDLDRDWMVSPQWLFWISTFRGARTLIETHCKLPFLQAVYSAHPYDWNLFSSHPMTLCDMQALGLYASRYEPHRYTIRQKTATEDPPIKQFWSHAPRPIELVSQYAPAPPAAKGYTELSSELKTQMDLLQAETKVSTLRWQMAGSVAPLPGLRTQWSSPLYFGTGTAQQLHLGQSG